MSNDEYNEKILQYLTGRLDPAEMEAFKKQIESDADLQQKVQEMAVEQKVVQALIKEEYREKLKQWMPSVSELADENIQDKPSSEADQADKAKVVPIKRKLLFKLSIAAGFLLLIGAGSYFWASANYSNSALVTHYYISPDQDILSGVKSGDPTIEQRYQEAKLAYRNNDFKKAVNIFQSLPQTDERALYFLAHSQYKLNDHTDAANTFKKVRTLNGRFQEKAAYYQLLSHLAESETGDEFQSLLTSITTDKNHSFNAEALNIQKSLNSFWRIWVE